MDLTTRRENPNLLDQHVTFTTQGKLGRFAFTFAAQLIALQSGNSNLGLDRIGSHTIENYIGNIRLICHGDNRAVTVERQVSRFELARHLFRNLCIERHIARLEAQFGDATYSQRKVRRWCQCVRQERKDLHDEVRSGRPPIDFLVIRILALLDEKPFHSAYSVAEALSVSHSTILSRLWESLGMTNFPLRWILYELTTSCDKFGWKLAESYCPFSNLTRK
jgi:hypothetical protein